MFKFTKHKAKQKLMPRLGAPSSSVGKHADKCGLVLALVVCTQQADVASKSALDAYASASYPEKEHRCFWCAGSGAVAPKRPTGRWWISLSLVSHERSAASSNSTPDHDRYV